MTVKNEVSSNHLQQLVSTHGLKRIKIPARVLITGSNWEGSIGERIVRACRRADHIVETFHADIRDQINIDVQPYDTLIMCHGVTELEWFEDISMDRVQEIFDVNVVGSYRMARKFVKQTINEDYRKRIIMIGSMAHRMVLNGSAAYCASKAALAMLGRCMAWELAPKGYDVFVIHPSNTRGTPMTEETIKGLMRYRGLSRAAAEAYWNDSPIRYSMLSTTEISELVLFLIGPHSSYLSGAQLELAGGQR